jgi:hypothetical protein
MKGSYGTLCDLAKSLESDIVKIGHIDEEREVLGKPFPLTLVPADSTKVNFVQVQEYMIKNHDKIIKAASEYGSVMFKGFDIRSGEEWASILYSTGLKEVNYVGGAAVRKLIVGTEGQLDNLQVLTTNESPPSEPIPFHHELAQTSNPPDHILFYCKENAAEGGSTPILRSDLVFNYLNEKYPAFITELEAKGVKYRRVVPEEDDSSSA